MRTRGLVVGLVSGLVWMTTAQIVLTQATATIDPDFKKYLVHYVDRRSLPEKLLNSFSLTSYDMGRSFALIAGVSHYYRMQEAHRYLAPADRDLDLLLAYLKDQQFFDEIVVLRDDAVSFDNLRYFLETYFPDRLKKYPKSRFLFAYSGHGMTDGDQGYLLTSSATTLKDKQHSIDMFALRGFSKQTVDAAYQSLFLINACHSGAFLGKTREGAWDVLLNRPGAHAIMSSGAADFSFGEADKGSFFYQKLIDGLNGAADPRGKGVITVTDLGSYLQTEVGLATGGKQVPTPPQDIWSGVSDGGLFFFNRQKALRITELPVWNPITVVALGDNLWQAYELWIRGDYGAELDLLQKLASNGNSRASAELGRLYGRGPKGVTKDPVHAVKLYQQAAGAGDAHAMVYLGFAYNDGVGGLAKDEVHAVKLYQQAADAGDALGMTNLGWAYDYGKGGLAKDEVHAVKLYQQAADAGDARAITNLGDAYLASKGGLTKDEVHAVKLFQQAADGGDGTGMTYLGVAYEHGKGGLAKDEARAVSLYQQASDAGDAYGMTELGLAYEYGKGGLTANKARAVQLYQQAAALHNKAAIAALKRLGLQ